MAKAAGKTGKAAKKASKPKRRKKPVEETPDPPIIIKGGPLPETLVIDTPAMQMEAEYPMDFMYFPDEEISSQYTYPVDVIGPIARIIVLKDGNLKLDEKVLGSTWEIQLERLPE